MNAYGFAAGDRINFSDPFGLCKDGDLDCVYLVNALRDHGGSAFIRAASRYEKQKDYEVRFTSKAGMGPWNQSQGVMGLTDPTKKDVWLVGESSRADFLVTAAHESNHMAKGTIGHPQSLFNEVQQAYSQLSAAERKQATFTKAWLEEQKAANAKKPPQQ